MHKCRSKLVVVLFLLVFIFLLTSCATVKKIDKKKISDSKQEFETEAEIKKCILKQKK